MNFIKRTVFAFVLFCGSIGIGVPDARAACPENASLGPGCGAGSQLCAIQDTTLTDDNCIVDLTEHDVVVVEGRVNIGAFTVKFIAQDFTIESGGRIEGGANGGGQVTIQSSGDIVLDSGGRIDLRGSVSAGTIVLDTRTLSGGAIVISGLLRADNNTQEADGGIIDLDAFDDIMINAGSTVDASGGRLAFFSGTVELDAFGDIEINENVDATGSSGGDMTIAAVGSVLLHDGDKVDNSALGSAEDGGELEILAGLDVEIRGDIDSRGGPEGGGGGAVVITAQAGDLILAGALDVASGAPDGDGGSADLFAGDTLTVQSSGLVNATGSGTDSFAGEALLQSQRDLFMRGRLLASGGESGGDVEVDGGRNVVVGEATANQPAIDASGREPGSEGGAVVVDAGTEEPGSLTIRDNRDRQKPTIDVRGAGCDGTTCSGGGDVEIGACDVTIEGDIYARTEVGTGTGGRVTLVARRQMTINGDVDATGPGGNGDISILHPSQTAPVQSGTLTPAPDLTACEADCNVGRCELEGFCSRLCSCGNGMTDEFEKCDLDDPGVCEEGETCGGPGSSDECRCIGTCGMPGIQAGEDCEPDPLDLNMETCETVGFPGGGDLGCTDDCQFDVSNCAEPCGDGFLGPDEVCDPGLVVEETCASIGLVGDQALDCLPDCSALDTDICSDGTCGDGFRCSVEECQQGPGGGPEECDDGNSFDTDPCLSSCARAVCGDGALCSHEDCDTGPDGAEEFCDDGNDSDNDACLNSCALPFCGDGVVCSDPSCAPQPGIEECDGGVCCLTDCTMRVCNETGPCVPAHGCCPPGETCDDGIACTEDSCEFFRGCVHTPRDCGTGGSCLVAADCDDGDPCNGAETCDSQGMCQAGVPLVCAEDDNPCTDARCDPIDGCIQAASTAPCDDGDTCTIGDTCSAGQCVSGVIVGAAGFECVSNRLTAPDVCESPLPKSLFRSIGRQLKKAGKATAKAEKLITQGAKAKKINKQKKKVRKALKAVEKSITKAEKSKKAKKSIPATCGSMLRGLTQQQEAVAAGLGG